MAKARLRRKPLNIKKSADITQFERVIEWEIRTEQETPINAYSLFDLNDGEKILKELKIFVRSQRKPSVYVYVVMNYIDFVANSEGVIW